MVDTPFRPCHYTIAIYENIISLDKTTPSLRDRIVSLENEERKLGKISGRLNRHRREGQSPAGAPERQRAGRIDCIEKGRIRRDKRPIPCLAGRYARDAQIRNSRPSSRRTGNY